MTQRSTHTDINMEEYREDEQESTCDTAVTPHRQQHRGVQRERAGINVRHSGQPTQTATWRSTERTSRNQRVTEQSVHKDSNKEEGVQRGRAGINVRHSGQSTQTATRRNRLQGGCARINM